MKIVPAGSLTLRCLVASALVFGLLTTGNAHEHTRHVHQQRSRAAHTHHVTLVPQNAEAKRAAGTCHLTVHLVDAATGQPLPGLVHITNVANGQPLTADELIHRPNDWYAMPGPSIIEVPRQKLHWDAVYGLETERASRDVDLAEMSEATARIPLQRFYHAASRQLHSGNTHLPLNRISPSQSDRYLQVAPRADGLDLFRFDVAQQLLAEMERNLAIIGQKGIFADEQEREAVLKVHREGMAILRERMVKGAQR